MIRLYVFGGPWDVLSNEGGNGPHIVVQCGRWVCVASLLGVIVVVEKFSRRDISN